MTRRCKNATQWKTKSQLSLCHEYWKLDRISHQKQSSMSLWSITYTWQLQWPLQTTVSQENLGKSFQESPSPYTALVKWKMKDTILTSALCQMTYKSFKVICSVIQPNLSLTLSSWIILQVSFRAVKRAGVTRLREIVRIHFNHFWAQCDEYMQQIVWCSNATSKITNDPLKVADSSPCLWPCPVQYVPAWHATHENADVTLPASPNSQQYIQDHHIDIHMVGSGAWTNFQTMTRWRVWKIQCDSGLWCVCRLYVKIIHPRALGQYSEHEALHASQVHMSTSSVCVCSPQAGRACGNAGCACITSQQVFNLQQDLGFRAENLGVGLGFRV